MVEWLDRMRDAIDLIEDSITRDIQIDEIAKRAYSSPYHFQRMFHMLTGITVREYIRSRRLTLAAQELAVSGSKVIDVALKYGYDSPESFAKAFRKAHGISPSEARFHGAELKAYPRISFHLAIKGDKEMDYKILNRESFRIVGKSLQVSMVDGENQREIPKFWEACHADGTVASLARHGAGKDLLGICMNIDHDTQMLTYLIAVEHSGDTVIDPSWITAEVPAATWAVFTSIGPMPHAIQDVWRRIFEEFFPSTGYQHGDGPELEVYPDGDAYAEGYRCEVWIPVVKD